MSRRTLGPRAHPAFPRLLTSLDCAGDEKFGAEACQQISKRDFKETDKTRPLHQSHAPHVIRGPPSRENSTIHYVDQDEITDNHQSYIHMRQTKITQNPFLLSYVELLLTSIKELLCITFGPSWPLLRMYQRLDLV